VTGAIRFFFGEEPDDVFLSVDPVQRPTTSQTSITDANKQDSAYKLIDFPLFCWLLKY